VAGVHAQQIVYKPYLSGMLDGKEQSTILLKLPFPYAGTKA
jgi:hypothetical protein